jgi:hypothetical protein
MVAIANHAETSVIAAGGGYRIERIVGTGGYGGIAASTAPISGDFVLRIRPLTDGLRGFVAVSAAPALDGNPVGLDYAVQFFDEALFVYESGVSPASALLEDTLWIERSGTTLAYRSGARRASATTIRALSGVTAPLYFETALASVGKPIAARFDAPGPWCDPRATTRRIALATGIGL